MYGLGLGKDFLGKTPKAHAKKGKKQINRTPSKLKTSMTLKDNLQNGTKYLQIYHIFNKGLLPVIHKNTYKSTNNTIKQLITQLKNGQSI